MTRPRCPVHDMSDCSPLLNGCSILTQPLASGDVVIHRSDDGMWTGDMNYPNPLAATTHPAGKWRVGSHYGIHVYDGNRPVATFHDPDDAALAVSLQNGAATLVQCPSCKGMGGDLHQIAPCPTCKGSGFVPPDPKAGAQ